MSWGHAVGEVHHPAQLVEGGGAFEYPPGAVVSANVGSLLQIDMSADTLKPLEEGMRETIQWYHDNWLPKYLASQA